MTGSSTGFTATVEVGFRRESSNPPSSSMADPHRPATPPVSGGAPTPGKKQQPSAAPTSSEKRPRLEATAATTPSAVPAAVSALAAASPAGATSGGIRNFFPPKTPMAGDAPQPTLAATPAPAAAVAQPPPHVAAPPRPSPDELAAAQARAAALEAQLAEQLTATQGTVAKLKKELEAARTEAEAATGVMEDLRREVCGVRNEQEAERTLNAAGTEALREALRQEAFRARAEVRPQNNRVNPTGKVGS